MKTLLTATLLTFILTVATLAEDITTTEAKKLISAGEIVIVDIRTPEEFAAGHIQGAKSIDFFSPNFEQELAKLDPKKTTIFHCKSGGRSTKALPTFKKLKFEKLYHLKAGFDSWSATQ